MNIESTVNVKHYPISDSKFQQHCQQTLAKDGVLVMPNFLTDSALKSIHSEGENGIDSAYFKKQLHNVYLTPNDTQYPEDHVYNRQITSSKGCITDDIIQPDSVLRDLYDSSVFKDFLCTVLDEEALHPYADNLSSINLHYAKKGQELGWHFDNSSFAITLMVQSPEKGGEFEYVTNVRNSEKGEMNFPGVERVLDGKEEVKKLAMDAGALVLFRGRNAIHRVTPNEGDITRMLVVLAYNSEPNVSLSESARMTFYGRLN